MVAGHNNVKYTEIDYTSTNHADSQKCKTCCFKPHILHGEITGLLHPIFQHSSRVFYDQGLSQDFSGPEILSFNFKHIPGLYKHCTLWGYCRKYRRRCCLVASPDAHCLFTMTIAQYRKTKDESSETRLQHLTTQQRNHWTRQCEPTYNEN